jgi:hypothetical protein
LVTKSAVKDNTGCFVYYLENNKYGSKLIRKSPENDQLMLVVG